MRVPSFWVHWILGKMVVFELSPRFSSNSIYKDSPGLAPSLPIPPKQGGKSDAKIQCGTGECGNSAWGSWIWREQHFSAWPQWNHQWEPRLFEVFPCLGAFYSEIQTWKWRFLVMKFLKLSSSMLRSSSFLFEMISRSRLPRELSISLSPLCKQVRFIFEKLW